MIVPSRTVAHYLNANHYLGATGRGFAWSDEYGVLVLAKPAVVRVIRRERREVTTVVSYSDPSVGHTGALYRACNWTWAPTWHRLRPPPSGNGSWRTNETQSVKDRWVYEIRPDERRSEILRVKDAACSPKAGAPMRETPRRAESSGQRRG